MSFEARYPGHCHACDERIHPGESVTHTEDNELIHAVCHSDERDHQAAVTVCSTCWTDHAGECL